MKSGFEVGSESISGLRAENQDSVAHFDSQFGHVFVLADGMGGHNGGAVASSLAVTRLPEILADVSAVFTPEEALKESIQELNRIVFTAGESGGDAVAGMGSTLVVLLLCDSPAGLIALGAHVGDSRLYFLRGERLFRLTQDHTVVERLVEGGILTPEQAIQNPQAGVLTRAVGTQITVAVDLTPWQLLQPDDLFLLCSDGLSAYASEEAIRETLLHGGALDEVAARLVDLALGAQSRDNISVLLARMVATPQPPAD